MGEKKFTRSLYEVLEEINLGDNGFGEEFILEAEERVWIYNHPDYEWPRIQGYDVALEDGEFEKFLKLIKVDEEYNNNDYINSDIIC